jgi:hypothetical protein
MISFHKSNFICITFFTKDFQMYISISSCS